MPKRLNEGKEERETGVKRLQAMADTKEITTFWLLEGNLSYERLSPSK
jgi:S-adenosylhomocysteine hydrolase